MKAREFTINVPINIKINGDGDPEIDVAGQDPEDEQQPGQDCMDPNPVMVPPLQQNIELKKAALGKEGDVVDKITQDADQSDPLEDVDDGKNKLVGVVFAGDDSHLED
jgi:hypothetical protein|tara:strand:+ start:170 stop:493 length:324 start_codon:yes stop_codon:yes gene_type:complete